MSKLDSELECVALNCRETKTQRFKLYCSGLGRTIEVNLCLKHKKEHLELVGRPSI